MRHELDGEGVAPKLTAKPPSIGPQIVCSCTGVDPILSENQEHRIPASRHGTWQEDEKAIDLRSVGGATCVDPWDI